MAEIQNTYLYCREVLLELLGEAAPGRIQLLTGPPRQDGRATLLLDIAAKFANQTIYAADDDPNAALPGFWERPWAWTLEIDEADSHIPTATTATGMKKSTKTGRRRDTHSEGKVKSPSALPVSDSG